jgi:PST family polysaccharide transporter
MPPLAQTKGARNFGWLLADRGVRLLVGLVVATWIARYLGPGGFGLLAFAASLTAIFAAVVPLGIDGLVVREILGRPEERGATLGTTLWLRLSCAAVCLALAIGYVVTARPGDGPALALTLILGVGLFAQAFETGELMYQAHSDMGRLVRPRLALFLGINVIKVVAIVNGASVFWFAALTAGEQIASGLITALLLRRYKHFGTRLGFTPGTARLLLRQGYPLAISSLAIIVYMKGGQLMLAQMLGDVEMGLYAAAIRIPDCVLFLPTALATSVVPALVRAHAAGGSAYESAMIAYMRASALLGIAIALPLTLAAPWLIELLFAEAYASAWTTMAIYVWALPFMFLGVARTQHLLNERSMNISLWFSLLGLALNLGANYALIPAMGRNGAALATLVAQIGSAVFASFLFPSTRRLARLQCLALLTPWLALRDARRLSARVDSQADSPASA